jgi:hypothetical protein
MSNVIFIDESIMTDLKDRPRVSTDVIPRAGDWVVIPGEEHARVMYHVFLVCLDYTAEPPEVKVRLDEHRELHYATPQTG